MRVETRSVTTVVLGLVLALGAAACGSKADKPAAQPSTKDYCAAVRRIAGPHRPAPAALVRRVEAVGNVAPGEVAREWHDIAEAVTAYAGAVERRRLDPAHPPVGLTPAKTRALNVRLDQNAYLTNVGPVRAQIRKVQRQVRRLCGVRTSL